MYLAHRDQSGRKHSLESHLYAVAEIAAASAKKFGSADWAGLAGLWHDLGKYSADFQQMLEQSVEAHLETKPVVKRVDHSTAGAIHAVKLDPGFGKVLAYIIAGHHAGLADSEPDGNAQGITPLSVRLRKQACYDAIAGIPPAAIMQGDGYLPKTGFQHPEALALWVKMLASCVFDADFLDTENFFDPDRSELRKTCAPVEYLPEKFNSHMDSLARGADNNRPLNLIRADILAHCRKAAARQDKLFSLTVPTGGGKTLSSLAFALENCKVHGRERVIYAIPYTSIIEQTADVFRKALGDDTVLEHHSNFDPDDDKETTRSRLLSENWDAPLIVTTTVQLFESLFAARTSRLRKIHNLANSVIILDEAQLLPVNYLKPILAVLDQLQKHFNTTVLFCTATQPSLSTVLQHMSPVEIISSPAELANQLRRVEPVFRHKSPLSWQAVADEAGQEQRVLCILNTRKDCRTLHGLMPEGTYHLSTWQCGAHRSRILAEIRDKLNRQEEVRVVSTQLVEAGVDIDFPVVWRALAGYESLTQAAGRCNREGRLEKGRLIVFSPENPPPVGDLKLRADTARNLLERGFSDIFAPDVIRQYFHELYTDTGDTRMDKHKIMDLLGMERTRASPDFSFRTAADRFRFIEDNAETSVLVPWDEGAELVALLRRNPEDWKARRKAQRYSVSLYDHTLKQWLDRGLVEEIAPGLLALTAKAPYNDRTGLDISYDEMPFLAA